MKQTINPIGQEINTLGKVINNKELMLVHLHLKSGEQIPSHDHKGQEVFFTIVAGTVEVALDDTTCRVQTLRNSVKYSRLKRHTNEEIFHWKRVEPE